MCKKIKYCFCIAALLIAAACSTNAPRVVEDFNFDWKFKLGDNPQWSGNQADCSDWRSLHLPHDWSIEGEFSADNPSTPGGGALPGGIGWYRKSFATPEGVPGKRVYVEFDGVFMNSTVWVNGEEMGTRPYGYSSFTYDITDALYTDGRANIIAVRCDNADQPNSRWYAGCGIYRNVRLVTVNPLHIAYSGLYITTPEISADKASVKVEAEVENPANVQYTLRYSVLDASGREVATSDQDCFTVQNPVLWSVDNPYVYTLNAQIVASGQIVDSYSQSFGFRTFDWDIDKGFFLNGQNVKLLGVCLHHDMGCLGTAVHTRALERQLQILKDMGCNAIRTSHNPPAPELLDLCDRMGFLVMDEAMDMWRKRKTEFDYSRFFDQWHAADVQDFVRRDRNHPSIFMWSIGNEILEQWNSSEDDVNNLSAEQANLLMNFMSSLPQYDAGEDNPNILLTKHMVDLIKELDQTRTVSSGCNETAPSNNLLRSGALDVYGFNYHTWDYDKIREWYPDKPLFGSETASSLNSRGIYFQPSNQKLRVPEEWWLPYDTEHHQCTAYDDCCAPWADLHEHAWYTIRERDYMAGTFVWTGFDYLGEPTPYSWPARSSYFGIVDLAGFPKDCYYMYQSEWTDKTVLHLFPHWNWEEGQNIDVWAYYNNADEVELFVNGQSFGKDAREGEKLHAQWLSVPYVPGRIEVVSYKDGREVARDVRETSGPASSLALSADRSTISADGYDLSYITVQAVDDQGRPVDNATDMLQFGVSGAGELVGVDNGNPIDHDCLKGTKKALFSGKALAVVRSVKGQKGNITLTVQGFGNSYKIDIKTR